MNKIVYLKNNNNNNNKGTFMRILPCSSKRDHFIQHRALEVFLFFASVLSGLINDDFFFPQLYDLIILSRAQVWKIQPYVTFFFFFPPFLLRSTDINKFQRIDQKIIFHALWGYIVQINSKHFLKEKKKLLNCVSFNEYWEVAVFWFYNYKVVKKVLISK